MITCFVAIINKTHGYKENAYHEQKVYRSIYVCIQQIRSIEHMSGPWSCFSVVINRLITSGTGPIVWLPQWQKMTLTTAKHKTRVHLSLDMLYACFIDCHYSERNIRCLITTDVYGARMPYGHKAQFMVMHYTNTINTLTLRLLKNIWEKTNNTCSRIRLLCSPVMTRVYTRFHIRY